MAKPGLLEPWDAPPTTTGFKGGDLLGIVEHLDHLEDLGISALYLNPVFQSAANHRYHTYDYLAVDPILGGNDALRELLDACHARGMRLILDGVFNHVGRGFWPFHHVLENGRDSPYRDWFLLDDAALDAGRPLRAYDPAAEHGDEPARSRLGYEAWWGLPALPKLNTDNPQLREFLFEVAEHWVRFGIDGWRLDVPMEIPDADFWREFRQRVRALKPDAYIVAEVWRPSPDTVGDRWDAVMNYPIGQSIIGFAGGLALDHRVVAQQHEYAAEVRPLDGSTFLARIGGLVSTYGLGRSLVQLNLLDSHDTPRVASLVGGDRTSRELAFLLLASLPGAPCLYYGDEIGLAGEMDPGCRGSMPWDRLETWDRELLDVVRRTIQLRARVQALRRGTFRALASAGSSVAFERRMPATPDGSEATPASVVVAVNAGDVPTRLEFEFDEIASGAWPAALSAGGVAGTLHAVSGNASLDLAGRTGAAFIVDAPAGG